GMLAVGFNRRFAPMAVALREAIARKNAPCSILMTINAGALPADHWLFDDEQGGRILGEACHFIDLSRALVGARITETLARGASGPDPAATIFLSFEDGSRATILYETRGASSFPKERIEVTCDGSTACIDDWRALKIWGWPGREARRTLRADNGHKRMLEAVLRACLGEDVTPISLSELAEVSQSTILAVRQCQS
ncbi:MAG: dehydrogenase, partial [Myxococcota bacterium]|nr:dehydrogenase [Myxococcota bacterium]